ncbi:LytTR family DNA-binding domain-containing protein [Algivirga pacifica]|uniref:LytTR family DNA-binding domain-containing protein n=1 Tax=Algivirga pacifica TaxID=1162670 RepID=A0ABP9CVC5_9BACT
MKVVIVEDEPLAQVELIRLLNACEQTVEVVESLDSIEDTVDWLQVNPMPDLLFLDIQLSDGLSFSIFEQLEITCPVIFTTAYDEYAIRAFRVNSIDYLLKPVEQEQLQQALDKYELLQSQYSAVDYTVLKDLMKGPKSYKDRFAVTLGERIVHVGIDEVAYFYADNSVVYLQTTSPKRYIVNYKLEQLEQLLNPRDFFRVNRTYLVALKSIESVHKYFNSRLLLQLMPATKEEVLVSRARVSSFMDWLEGEV